MEGTLTITVPDGDEQRLTSLYQWLQQSPRVTANATVSLESEPAPGTMGDRLDRISVGVASGLAGVQIIIGAIGLWQGSQQAPAPVDVRIGTVIVQVDGGTPEDVQRLKDALTAGRSSAGSGQER